MSIRFRFSTTLGFVMALASTAWAQAPAAGGEAPAKPAATPAEGKGAGDAAAGGDAAAVEPSAEQKELARQAFHEGNDLYDAGRFEEALTSFQRSYSAVASPNTRLMIGRTLERLGRLGQAYDELVATEREALERGGKYIKAGEAAHEAAEALRPAVGLLTIQVVDAPEGASVTVQEREVPASAGGVTVAVMPGDVTVVAVGDGRTVSAQANVVAGGEGTVELVMTPEPEAPVAAPVAEPQTVGADSSDGGGIPLRTWGYVAGGIGVAGLVTFGVVGALSQSKFNDLEEACVGGVCPPELEDDIDQGRTYQTIANIGLIVGAVGLATGVTLIVIGGSDGPDEQTARRTSLRVGPGSIQVGGTF